MKLNSWRDCLLSALITLGGFLVSHYAWATPPAIVAPSTDEPNDQGQAQGTAVPGLMNGLQRSSYLFGDLWGLRPLLSKYGMSLTILETSEVLGNVSGGAKQGFEYDGLTQMALQLDTQRAFHLYGGTFNISALQIHGDNLSADNLLTLQTASGIEADRATRLWELWYQQKFLEEDRLDIKLGEQSLDQEFMVTQNGLLFVNTMFGWPMLPSADLPGGGPAYPLAALGMRFRYRPINSLTFLAGVFNGSPVTSNEGDPQRQNPSGGNFPLNGGALVIGEVQYAFPAVGNMVYAGGGNTLAGVYKLGGWYDSEQFSDQQFDNTGKPLSSPFSTGAPRSRNGDYSLYAVMDQMIWRDPTDEDGDRSISYFTRAMGTPEEDRNLIDFSLNAGFTFHEPIYHRDDDTCGIGMGFAHVGDHARDVDNGVVSSFTPARTSETFIEATYQYQFTPWCQIQPDFQYVFNPGGGVANPYFPNQKVKDEAVLGVRLNVLF